MTPVLSSLHWLPVRYRIDFKNLLFVFKSLYGLAPEYLSNLINVHRPSRALRSADQLVPDAPGSLLKTKGDRAFALCGALTARLQTHLFTPAGLWLSYVTCSGSFICLPLLLLIILSCKALWLAVGL